MDKEKIKEATRKLRERKTELRKGYADSNMKEKYELYDIETIGYLDIETSGLNADFDIMLSWANLIRNVKTGKIYTEFDYIEKKDFDMAYKKSDADLSDKRIVETCVDSLKQCDLLIGHWFIGKHRHDIPFIRARCAINHVSGFPHHKKIKYGDRVWLNVITVLKMNRFG